MKKDFVRTAWLRDENGSRVGCIVFSLASAMHGTDIEMVERQTHIRYRFSFLHEGDRQNPSVGRSIAEGRFEKEPFKLTIKDGEAEPTVKQVMENICFDILGKHPDGVREPRDEDDGNPVFSNAMQRAAQLRLDFSKEISENVQKLGDVVYRNLRQIPGGHSVGQTVGPDGKVLLYLKSRAFLKRATTHLKKMTEATPETPAAIGASDLDNIQVLAIKPQRVPYFDY